MKTRWLLTVLLGVLVLALGSVAYMMPRGAEHGFAISALAAGEVARIRIARAGEAPVVLERIGNDWRISEPVRAAADPAEVNRLLAVLGARSPQRMAPVELGRFELDRPHLRLAFNGEALDFGMVSAIAREQYVLVGGAVYVIEPKYTAHIPRTAAGFAHRRLLPRNGRLARLDLPDFTVIQDSGAWSLLPQAPDTNAEELVRFVDAWRDAVAQRVERAGADTPQGHVAVRLADGTTIRLGIVRRERETVMRDTAGGLDFLFPEAAARRLLSRPGSGPRQHGTDR